MVLIGAVGGPDSDGRAFRHVVTVAGSVCAVTEDGRVEPLTGSLLPDLGTDEFPHDIQVNETRVVTGERLLLLSDGVTGDLDVDRPGIAGIRSAAAKAAGGTAPATLRAIEDLVRELNPEHLIDDAALIVLTPSGMIGPDDQ